MKTLLPSIFFNLFLCLGALQAQVIDQLIDPISLEVDGTTLTVVFEDLRKDTSMNFEAQHSENVSTWTGITSANVVGPSIENDPPQHFYTLTADDPGGLRKFYRIIGYSTTAEDSDGDGLSDEFETLSSRPPASRTLANKVDSDYDGYSDGVEFAAGTDPNVASSKPNLGELPQVEFEQPNSEHMEGDPIHMIPLSITKGYSGSISYQISMAGTTDPPFEGTTPSNNGTASIPFFIDDDAVVEPKFRLYLIDITNANLGVGYNPSGTVTHVVVVSDNDAYWSGKLVVEEGAAKTNPGPLESLRDQPSDRDFRVCITRATGNDVVIQFRSGSSDGFVQPDGGNSSQSTGVIPDKDIAGADKEIFDSLTEAEEPFRKTIFTPTHFEALTPPLPVATAGFLDNAPLQRQIHLLADTTASPDPGVIQTTKVFGYFTDTVTHVPPASGPTPTYLASEVKGFFVLVKDIPQEADIPSPFVP